MKPTNFMNLFHGQVPPVREFNREMDLLSLAMRQRQLYALYRTSFWEWRSLSLKHRDFVLRVIEHDRQIWLDYLLEETIMGRLRYELKHPQALLRSVKILEYLNAGRRISLNHLSMDLLTAFDYSYRLSTMGDYIRQMEITPEYGLEFLGIVELEDW